jgi:hypothetical protein
VTRHAVAIGRRDRPLLAAARRRRSLRTAEREAAHAPPPPRRTATVVRGARASARPTRGRAAPATACGGSPAQATQDRGRHRRPPAPPAPRTPAPHLRGSDNSHAPAVAEPFAQRLERLRSSLLGSRLSDRRRCLGEHRQHLADARRARQQCRLAERRRGSTPLEQRASPPLEHRSPATCASTHSSRPAG